MKKPCRTCKAVSCEVEYVPTAQSPEGVLVGSCVNCDRRKCSVCKSPIADGSARTCPHCGAVCYLVAPTS